MLLETLQIGGQFNSIKNKTGATNFPTNLTKIAAKLINTSIKTAKQSHHHRFKVGSTLYTQNNDTGSYLSYANKIPRTLRKNSQYGSNFTPNDPDITKVGDGHPTVHGEFRILYGSDPDAECTIIGCNTPLCANCMKTAIMRGVDAIIVDEASLPGNTRGPLNTSNPWSEDRKELWFTLCLELARMAKVPVYSVSDTADPNNRNALINPDKAKLKVLAEGVPPPQRPKPQFPAQIFTREEFEEILEKEPEKFLSKKNNIRRAVAAATDQNGNEFFIYAKDSHPPGFSTKAGKIMTKKFENAHYKFTLDPLIHIAMEASKKGLKLRDGRIATNFIPDSGRQLELAYVGLKHLLYRKDHIQNDNAQNDGELAMWQLSAMGLIEYSATKPNEAMRLLLRETTPPNMYNTFANEENNIEIF